MSMLYANLFYFAALIDQNAAGIPTAGSFKLNDILNAVYFWAGVVAVIIIIAAGFMYVVSANNQTTITRAKNAILSSIIGLVIILLAFGITNIVISGAS